MYRRTLLLTLILFASTSGSHVQAIVRGIAPVAPIVQLQPVLTGLSAPVLATNAHDGSNRIFIVEQTGLIKVLLPGSVTSTVFLDITSKRLYGGERGLLGLAFHPQFKVNRRFFINYTRAGDGATVVAEYAVSPSNPNLALTTEKVLLVVSQPFSNHNGGMIEFGPDGLLYIGMGDGGSANDPGNRAQNRNELLGKMLRIDIDQTDGATAYASPPGNPFFGAVDGRDEIFALGLRNPWRFSFDRLTGELYAGDVGQGQREEVDIVTRGGNYGWRVYEATRCTGNDPLLCTAANYIAPILEYSHTGSRCSLTGGYVYRGLRSSLPFGAYVYGDYCTGEIFISQGGTESLVLDTNLSISSFGEDESGELYVCDLGGGVFRLTNPAAGAAAAVSAASFRGESLAPGSIAAAFGAQLATGTASATLPLPTNLLGSEIKIRNGVTGIEHQAQLFFVSPGQINFLLPESIPSGPAEVRITNAEGSVSTGIILITPVTPGIFSANANGSGVAAGYVTRVKSDNQQTIEQIAVYHDAEQTYAPSAIDLGPPDESVVLTLFATGMRLRSSTSAVTVQIGNDPQQVLFAGAQGFFIGLDQINVALSRALISRGDLDVLVTVEGTPANPVRVRFK